MFCIFFVNISARISSKLLIILLCNKIISFGKKNVHWINNITQYWIKRYLFSILIAAVFQYISNIRHIILRYLGIGFFEEENNNFNIIYVYEIILTRLFSASNSNDCAKKKNRQRSNKNEKISEFFHRHVPITMWLPKYDSEQAMGDLIAGTTIGLTMIPQSIAYASLANLSPQACFLRAYIYI